MKLLLLDDEPLVRSYIRLQLEQLEGLEVECVEAASGQEALMKMAEEEPEAAFIDIRMPGMNGIEVIRRVVERFPNVACIMLSGYDDFSYVRDSMAIGAYDYLLKHRITRHVLLDTLKGAMNKRAQRMQADAKAAQADRTARLALPLMEERMLRAALAAEPMSGDGQDMWEKLLTRLGGSVCLAVCEIRRAELQAMRTERHYHLRQRIQTVMRDTMDQPAPIVAVGEVQWVTLLGAADAERRGQQVAKMGNALRLFLNLHPQIVVSQPFTALQDCAMQYHQTLTDAETDSLTSGLTPAQTERLLGALNSRSVLFLQSECARLFTSLLENGTSEQREKVLDDTLAVLRLFAEQSAIRPDSLLEGEAWRKLHTAQGPDRVNALCQLALQFMQAAEKEGVQERYNAHIEKAAAYIRAHYLQPLTLEKVAEHVGVAPTYLSRLFREYCSCTFIEYINQYRVELACRYLKRGTSATETAYLVGFATLSYFFRVFKGITGQTPAAYLKECKIVHDSGKTVDC